MKLSHLNTFFIRRGILLNHQMAQILERKFYNTPCFFKTNTCNPACVHQQIVLMNQKRYASTDKKPPDNEDDEPIKFSTSKAASWSVDESFGKRHQKPTRKVLPISLIAMAILAWAFFRSESEIDKQLEVGLRERLPQMFSEKQVEQFEPLPDWTKTLKEKGSIHNESETKV